MNNLWMSYLLACCTVIFWVANIAGQIMAKSLYEKLCSAPLPSAFSLTHYSKIKKCVFALDLEKLIPSDISKINRTKLAIKIQDISLIVILVLAVVTFARQGFKFV